MSDRKNSRRLNEHAGPPGHPNGHGPASAERGGVSVPVRAGRHGDRAASDDVSRTPVASAAAFPAAASPSLRAGTDCEAYAEVAPPAPTGVATVLPETTSSASRQHNDEEDIPPGENPLPLDVEEFVQEIHSKIDLTEVWHSLLRSKDDKIRQRAVERLTDLLYKGPAASGEEPQQVIFDFPKRD